MEMIKIHIPVADFTITADVDGIVVSFKKPHSCDQPQDTLLKEVFVHPVTAPVQPHNAAKQKRGGRKRSDNDRHILGHDVIETMKNNKSLTGIGISEIIKLVAVKTDIKEASVRSMFYKGVTAPNCVAEEIAHILNVRIEAQPEIDGFSVWRIVPDVDGEENSDDQKVVEDTPSDTLQQRIHEATKPHSLPGRATLSEGLETLIEDYLANSKVSKAVFCYELAVRIGMSMTAVQLMLEGTTEATESLINILKKILKIDIVRLEDDGKAIWEGV